MEASSTPCLFVGFLSINRNQDYLSVFSFFFAVFDANRDNPNTTEALIYINFLAMPGFRRSINT